MRLISEDFMGYRLDKNPWDITEKEIKRLSACVFMINCDTTFRNAEKNYGVPRSTLSLWIHTKLKYISDDLYQSVLNQIKLNKERRIEHVKKANRERGNGWGRK